MLNWNDVIKYANHGNPDPDRTVVKSTEQWMTQLTPEEYRVTRGKGTEAQCRLVKSNILLIHYI